LAVSGSLKATSTATKTLLEPRVSLKPALSANRVSAFVCGRSASEPSRSRAWCYRSWRTRCPHRRPISRISSSRRHFWPNGKIAPPWHPGDPTGPLCGLGLPQSHARSSSSQIQVGAGPGSSRNRPKATFPSSSPLTPARQSGLCEQKYAHHSRAPCSHSGTAHVLARPAPTCVAGT
jgi:hypothetical protein